MFRRSTRRRSGRDRGNDRTLSGWVFAVCISTGAIRVGVAVGVAVVVR
ncbi:hypothetical protein [Arthrobacter sp. CAN_A1]